MKLRTALASAVVSATTVAGLITGTQAATAAPAHDIHYTAHIEGQSVIVKTDAGSLRTKDGQFQVVDTHGKVAVALPLAYKAGNNLLPIAATTTGNSAKLTPQLASKHLATQPSAPLSKKDRNQQALNNLGANVGTAVTIGSLVGTIIGAGLGCLLGPAGCLAGLVTGAGIGGVVGTIAAGGPTLIGNVIEYFKTVNSPGSK